MDFRSGDFIWDRDKELINIRKHGIDFIKAAQAFHDPKRKIYRDSKHSADEPRLFCLGKVDGKVITVRFVQRNVKIRIFGAGYWRKGEEIYEQEN